MDRLVDNLEITTASKLLELDNGKFRFNARSVAVHHQTNCTGGGNNADLRIAESMLFTLLKRLIPHLANHREQLI